jgi:LuxR family transcriptional regulator, quorum-sensing system regulator CviR
VYLIKRAAFSFVGRKINSADRTTAIIQNTVPHLSVALMRLAEAKKESKSFTPKLTNREVEVLKWIKEGKSSYDVSVILNISERTVNFHCNNILRKLDAVNRVQAVAIALEKRIIGW